MEIKIYGEIMDGDSKEMATMFGLSNGTSFTSIDEALATKADDDNTIKLRIHSCGGLCSEGYAIYDRLRSVPNATIEAEVEGECSSMATIVLLAASVRRAKPNSRFCLHKPYMFVVDDHVDEDKAMRLHNDLHDETERMLTIYTERTGHDRNELEALMREDKYITAEQAKELGLIHEIIQPLTASKMSKPSITQKLLLKALAASGMTAEEIAKAMKADNAAVAMTLNTDDGSQIEIDRESGEPQVGDLARPDGEHHMPNGDVIIIVDGIITEIRQGEEERKNEEEETTDNGELEQLRTENENLRAENERLTAENEELKARIAELEGAMPSEADKAAVQFVAECGGIEALKALKSDYKPAQRETKTSANKRTRLDEEYDRMFGKK